MVTASTLPEPLRVTSFTKADTRMACPRVKISFLPHASTVKSESMLIMIVKQSRAERSKDLKPETSIFLTLKQLQFINS